MQGETDGSKVLWKSSVTKMILPASTLTTDWPLWPEASIRPWIVTSDCAVLAALGLIRTWLPASTLPDISCEVSR
jgi:hypothetical protein